MRREAPLARPLLSAFAVAVFCLSAAGTLWSQEPSEQTDPPVSRDDQESDTKSDADDVVLSEEISVSERADNLVGLAATSSEGVTGAEALAGRPIQRAGEILETVPGLIATQHSGDGKANQYFVRGFNLDHGTDFGVLVSGMPVNQPSHGHGQGYTDVNFLVPELVSTVRFRKGTAVLTAGDFSAAGNAEIELVGALDRGFAELTFGEWNYSRAVAANTFSVGGGSLTAGVEVHANDGPWERGNDFERFNGFLRYRHGGPSNQWTVTAMGYDGSWLSTDQVPKRAIASGQIGRFGLIDPGTGGESSRTSLSIDWQRATDKTLHDLTVYTLQSDLNLTSNFTYFLEDEELGDQFIQLDDRRTSGLSWESSRWFNLAERRARLLAGGTLRFDEIDNGLFPSIQTADGSTPVGTVRSDRVDQMGGGLFAGVEVWVSDKFRLTSGLRFDFADVDVRSDLTTNSGGEEDTIVSPKLAVVLGPWASTEIYASYGRGFHSNDARGAAIRVDPTSGAAVDPVGLLVPARGYEVGVRTAALNGLQSTLTLYGLELESELVFVGDGGTTEAVGRSRRLGVEWANAWEVRPDLTVEFDAAWVKAELRDEPAGARNIPGALETVISGGVDWRPDPWRLTFRLRAFDGYPLIEDGSVESRPFFGLNARIARNFGGLELHAELFNLLDRQDNDIEYFYASRLAGEPTGGVEDIHLHPTEPFNARLGLTLRL